MTENYSRSDGISALSSDVTLTSLDINMQIPQCLQNMSNLTKEYKQPFQLYNEKDKTYLQVNDCKAGNLMDCL